MEKFDQDEIWWGILGCGRISSDFVRAVRFCETPNKICAVATADSVERADAFYERNKHELDGVNAYGTYEELLEDPEIDVVYIANLNHQHRDAVLQALDAGKHVLCEKPMGVNAREVREMVKKAREEKLFLMEGYWTRCFPVWRELLDQKLPQIGPVDAFQCDFGFPVNRVNSTDGVGLGGEGYLMASGCYAVMAAQMVFGGGGKQRPVEILAKGELCGKGFDTWAQIFLRYPGNKLAQIFYSGQHRTPGSLSIHGKHGSVRIPEFFWSPVEAEITRYPENQIRQAGMCRKERISHPLPPEFDQSDYFYPHGAGLAYEIDHVSKCLRKNHTESPWMGMEESVAIAEILDEVRRQLGFQFPQDNGKLD